MVKCLWDMGQANGQWQSRLEKESTGALWKGNEWRTAKGGRGKEQDKKEGGDGCGGRVVLLLWESKKACGLAGHPCRAWARRRVDLRPRRRRRAEALAQTQAGRSWNK